MLRLAEEDASASVSKPRAAFPRLVEEDAQRPSRNLASWFVHCVGGFETLSSFAPQPAGVREVAVRLDGFLIRLVEAHARRMSRNFVPFSSAG